MIINGAWILAGAFLYVAWRVACRVDARATDRENGSES